MDLVQGALVEETRRPVRTHQLRGHLHEVRAPESRLGFGRVDKPHALVLGRKRLPDTPIEAHGHVGANGSAATARSQYSRSWSLPGRER